MRKKSIKSFDAQDVEKELHREQYKNRYKRTLKSTFFALLTAAAAAILIATLWLPVLQIFGSSMVPTLQEGQIIVSIKTENLEPGDIVAFYYGNKVLVKRYIAGAGSFVDIRADGTVFVDGVPLEEPYIKEKALGNCDLSMPYQVPEGTYFLIGDERENSIDSRHSSVGCISADRIVGKIVYRVWPFEVFGVIN